MGSATGSLYRSAAGRAEMMAIYERVLAGWPAPSEQLHVPARHGATFVIATGDTRLPPLVLLHGSGSNSATWAGDVARYRACCRVYAVDIPGEAGKSAETRFSCRGPAFREWLDDVLDGLGLPAAILGGMSLGGWAALDYAIYRPERVLRLALICPSGVCPPKASFGLAALFLMPLGAWGLERMKRRVFQGAEVGPDAERFFDLTAKHFNYRREAPVLFTDDELRHAVMPVLMLAGENDAVLQSHETAARLERLLPHCRTIVYGRGGHALTGVGHEVEAFLGAG